MASTIADSECFPPEIELADLSATTAIAAPAPTAPPARSIVAAAATACTYPGCGLNFAFGCYQEYYEDVDGPFGGRVEAAKESISSYGTLAVSLMTIFAPWTSAYTARYGPGRVTLMGAALFALSMITASAGTQMWHFWLMQGVIVDLGTCLSYIPAVTVAPGWFDKHRGLALGIVLSATGIGGLVWAPLTSLLIITLGFRNVLRVTGGVGFVLIADAAGVLDWAPGSRPGEAGGRTAARRGGFALVDWRVARGRVFVLKAGTATLQAPGYYFPLYFISSYAYRVGMSKQGGANLLGLSNGLSAVGKLVLGALADRYGRLNMLCFCCVVSAAGVLTLWMPSAAAGAGNAEQATAVFYGFVVVYGLTAGGYVSLFPTILVELFGVQHFASINGLMYCVRGVGTLVGTPVTSLLLRGYAGKGALAEVGLNGGKGNGYVNSIALNGAVLGAAAAGAMCLRLEMGKRDGWRWKL